MQDHLLYSIYIYILKFKMVTKQKTDIKLPSHVAALFDCTHINLHTQRHIDCITTQTVHTTLCLDTVTKNEQLKRQHKFSNFTFNY